MYVKARVGGHAFSRSFSLALYKLTTLSSITRECRKTSVPRYRSASTSRCSFARVYRGYLQVSRGITVFAARAREHECRCSISTRLDQLGRHRVFADPSALSNSRRDSQKKRYHVAFPTIDVSERARYLDVTFLLRQHSSL